MKYRKYWWQLWRKKKPKLKQWPPVLKLPVDIPKWTELRVKVHKMVDATAQERIKFKKAMALFEECANSEEFKEAVLDAYMEEKDGYSNEQIYQMLMSGVDDFDEMEDGEVDVFISFYYEDSGTLGYTYPNTFKTWVNRKFFRHFTLGDMAGNVLHEAMHNLGLDHTDANPDSVPYVYGDIMTRLVNEKINGTLSFRAIEK